MSYTSVEPKSARERYIRVEETDIVISEGSKNICRVAGERKNFDHHTANKKVPD